MLCGSIEVFNERRIQNNLEAKQDIALPTLKSVLADRQHSEIGITNVGALTSAIKSLCMPNLAGNGRIHVWVLVVAFALQNFVIIISTLFTIMELLFSITLALL